MEIQYRIANKIIDILTRFEIDKHIFRAVEFDFKKREEIDSFQKEKFDVLVSKTARSKFYRDFYKKEYHDFPVMTREIFMRNIDNLKNRSHRPYKIVYSSGSTNFQVKHYITREMLLAKRLSHQKMLNWYGLNRESPEFKIGGLPPDLTTRLYYYFKNKRHFSSYDITEKKMPELIRMFNDIKPKVLSGYPSALQLFLKFSKINHFKLHSPRIIVTHAENLFPDTVETFKTFLPDSKIVNQYWSTEGNIAVTCPFGNLHIDEDTVICELINQDKNGVGDLLITNLYSYSVPYIRYKIGDRLKFSDTQCPCGRHTKVIEFFEGREIEYLELKNGKKYPITPFVFGDLENILSFQMEYHKEEEKVIFRYIPINEFINVNKEKIAEKIKFTVGLKTYFEKVKEIDFTRGGKYKRLVVLN